MCGYDASNLAVVPECRDAHRHRVPPAQGAFNVSNDATPHTVTCYLLPDACYLTPVCERRNCSANASASAAARGLLSVIEKNQANRKQAPMENSVG